MFWKQFLHFTGSCKSWQSSVFSLVCFYGLTIIEITIVRMTSSAWGMRSKEMEVRIKLVLWPLPQPQGLITLKIQGIYGSQLGSEPSVGTVNGSSLVQASEPSRAGLWRCFWPAWTLSWLCLIASTPIITSKMNDNIGKIGSGVLEFLSPWRRPIANQAWVLTKSYNEQDKTNSIVKNSDVKSELQFACNLMMISICGLGF